MAIRFWANDYNSGIALIDGQHKKLFQLINDFEETYDEAAPDTAIAAFLESVINDSSEHFTAEEDLMEQHKYPLADYHKSIHTTFRQNMMDLMWSLYKGKLDNAYYEVVDLVSKWQHHVVRDDLTIFYYLKNKDFKLGQEAVGRPCEVSNLDNQLLSYGTITSVTDDNIGIECKNKYMQLWFNDVVKISLFTLDNDFICFASKVYYKKENELKIYKGAVMKTTNDRMFFRLPAKISAVISSDAIDQAEVTILDISAGGLLVEGAISLGLGDEVLVEFTFQKINFAVTCKVMRLLKKDAARCQYGMMFINMNKHIHSDLVKLLLQQQAMHIKDIKRMR